MYFIQCVEKENYWAQSKVEMYRKPKCIRFFYLNKIPSIKICPLKKSSAYCLQYIRTFNIHSTFSGGIEFTQSIFSGESHSIAEYHQEDEKKNQLKQKKFLKFNQMSTFTIYKEKSSGFRCTFTNFTLIRIGSAHFNRPSLCLFGFCLRFAKNSAAIIITKTRLFV